MHLVTILESKKNVNVNMSKRVGKDGVFLGLTGLLLGKHHP